MISRRRILAVAAAPLIQYAPARAQEPLLVLGWDGYLDQPAIDRFKHATGIDVVLDVVGSYDEIFTQLRAGGVHRYSVIAPHHGLIGDLQQRGFIQPLDPNQIPHLAEIDSHFALTDTTVIDGAKYGAALIFDTCPALYNADLLPEPPNNWLALASDLYTGKVGMLDDGFSHFNLWGRAIGAAHPPNLSANEMLATTAILSELKQNRVSHFTPYPADLVAQLANSKAVISTTGWGGLTLLPDRGKANIKVVHLQPGDFSFVQVLAITAEAPQVPAAHQFINFMLSPNEQAALANRTTRAIVNLGAVPMIDPAISGFTNYADLDSVMAQSPPLGFPPIGETTDGTVSYLDWALAWDKVRSLKSTAAP
ncbi:MAG TPA: extracellular solute-binding protein [Thermomicrobiales bacterium]|nr:extracellular solute-binding protein [Thermomicrobiales bacterium]